MKTKLISLIRMYWYILSQKAYIVCSAVITAGVSALFSQIVVHDQSVHVFLMSSGVLAAFFLVLPLLAIMISCGVAEME